MQDARYVVAWPNRASSVDLLDNYHPASCTKELDTCLNEFTVDFIAPDVTCTDQGVCGDPFKVPATGVPVPQTVANLTGATDMRDPGGGVQVRLVFDKVLDNSIEKVTPITGKAPGSDKMYALVPGIVDLVDSAGKSVPSEMYYDNGGSPEFSSDLELVPLGPAIVIKPTQTLDAATKYTVKILNPGALKDRQGNAAVGLNGGALPTSLDFTTEGLTPDSAGVFGPSAFDYPADFSKAPSIFPDEVIQFAYFENIAGDTATIDPTSTMPAGAKPLAFTDRGSDPTMCSATMAPAFFVLDLVNTDTGMIASAKPAPWPAGDYDIKVTVKDINGKSMDMEELKFTVAGCKTDDDCAAVGGEMCDTTAGTCSKDPNSSSKHITPAECTG